MATKPSALIDTRVIYCGDNLDQLRKFPATCVDLTYIDPPFNSNRNYEIFLRLFEIDRFRCKEGRGIKPLTLREILDEEIANKLT
jgi:DNA modification methylase